LETCESAGEVVPGILFTKNSELFQARRSYFKTFGLQHPHTGTYFHSPNHNDLLSVKQLEGLGSELLPDYAARLQDSPLKSPTFKLLRNKPGKNPLAFTSDRSPINFENEIKAAIHPRRPWSSEFASCSSINGSFSMSSFGIASAKNRSPVTRALSPTSAMLLSPSVFVHSGAGNEKSSFASKKGSRKYLAWDSSGSSAGLFETKTKCRAHSKKEWT
jgi:hypothetical protein